MQRYYILLKATGAGGWPGWLPYRLDADSAEQDRKSTRMNSSHNNQSRMPSSA